MTEEEFAALPESLDVRVVRYSIAHKGFELRGRALNFDIFARMKSQSCVLQYFLSFEGSLRGQELILDMGDCCAAVTSGEWRESSVEADS
jgi:hypothetical protein